MNLKEFKESLAIYGADLLRWPQEQKAKAEALIENSEDARKALATFNHIDDLMDPGDAPAVPAGLADKILEKSGKDKK